MRSFLLFSNNYLTWSRIVLYFWCLGLFLFSFAGPEANACENDDPCLDTPDSMVHCGRQNSLSIDAPVLLQQDPRLITAAWNWLSAKDNWQKLADSLLADYRKLIYVYYFAGFLILSLLIGIPFMNKTLLALGRLVRKKPTSSFSLTAQSLGLTMLASTPIPLLTGFLGFRIDASSQEVWFVRAIGEALLLTSYALYSFILFLKVVQKGGMVDSHLQWSDKTRRRLKFSIVPAAIFSLIFVFLFASMQASCIHGWGRTLGRLGLIGILFTQMFFLFAILRSEKEILMQLLGIPSDSIVIKSHAVFANLIPSIPLVLAGASLIGFHCAVYAMTWRILATMWFVFGFSIFRQLVYRRYPNSKPTAGDNNGNNNGQVDSQIVAYFRVPNHRRVLLDLIASGGLILIWGPLFLDFLFSLFN